MSIMYHDGNRRLQDGSTAAGFPTGWRRSSPARRSPTTTRRYRRRHLFLPRHGGRGRPSRLLVQGRHAGFRACHRAVRARFPDYDGNGMFKSLGNVLVNPNVGLLFIDLHEKPRRLRVNGTATVNRDDPLLAHTVGAQMIVRVQARAIFPNCPRYIPQLALTAPSIYPPRAGCDLPEPKWKSFPDFKDHMHPRQSTFRG